MIRASFAVVVLALVSCAPAPAVVVPSPSAATPCETAGSRQATSLDPEARLVAAFVSTLADVASWEAHGYGTGSIQVIGPTRSGVPLDRVDVCYYEGSFSSGGHPFSSAAGAIRRYDLLVVTVSANGVARVATAGFRESMPIAGPPHGP